MPDQGDEVKLVLLLCGHLHIYVMHAVDIIHDFYVKKDGKYKVFVENRYKKKIKIGIAICLEK